MSARGEEPIREANANASPTVECAFHRAFHTRHPSSALPGANAFANGSRNGAGERVLRASCSFSLPRMALAVPSRDGDSYLAPPRAIWCADSSRQHFSVPWEPRPAPRIAPGIMRTIPSRKVRCGVLTIPSRKVRRGMLFLSNSGGRGK